MTTMKSPTRGGNVYDHRHVPIVCHFASPRAARVTSRRFRFLRFPDISPFFFVGGVCVQVRKTYSAGGRVANRGGARMCMP